LTGVDERLRSVDSIVIGQDDGREADLPAATSNLKGRDPAIKGSRAVQVQIDADLGLRSFPPPPGQGGGGVRPRSVLYARRGLREGSAPARGSCWRLDNA
jgi:hypothetical protein